MKWVIWNKTQDKFWSDGNINDDRGHWTNRYYASKYTLEEIEKKQISFFGYDDIIFGVIAISV